SFGNRTRIDYGTGHEASFTVFLCCLFKLRVFKDNDKETIVLQIFNRQVCFHFWNIYNYSCCRYLHLMHRLQSVYRMEPAGSHGVWGLDDYQFIPFIWGSAQLIDHPDILPKSFLDPHIVEQHSQDYMFIDCIKFINTVRNSLAEKIQVKVESMLENPSVLFGVGSEIAPPENRWRTCLLERLLGRDTHSSASTWTET
ncbi:hypothetical protein QZH41_016507, partial [Actinostola sp. cb2023]